MPVTILYQGSPLTFPNLDNPDEAYAQLGVSNPNGPAPSGSDNADAPGDAEVMQLDGRHQKDGIDPALLKQNKDWLLASKTLYNATQGHNWDDSWGDEKLADWGLDRMARFNYNLPMMGVDALSMKNAPATEKKAFLYLLDTFEKTEHSWAGAGRFAKWAALDPTNYVGLATLGVGTAANEAAKLTSVAGVKAALKTGLVGAVEGAIAGGAQQRIEQEARVNAGGQESVDYGRVGAGAAIGGAFGAALAPMIAVGKNHFFPSHLPEKAPGAPVEGIADPLIPKKAGPETQLDLGLGDMTKPAEAAQVNMARQEAQGRLGMGSTAEQPTLPGFAQNDLSKPGSFDDLPLQRDLTKLPDSIAKVEPKEGIDDAADRLMKDWGVSHQTEMFPEHPQDRRLPAQAGEDTIKLESSKAQGELFDNLPRQTRDAIDATVEKAADLNAAAAGSPLTKGKGLFDSIPKPLATEKIGAENGPSLFDLKRLLTDVGSTVDQMAVRGWQEITDASSPLVRALVNLTDKDAKEIATKFQNSAMTQGEFKAFVNATINAQNTVAHYIDTLLASRAKAVTVESKAQITKKIVVAERIMDPLKTLAKTAGTTSSVTLNDQKQNLFKGLQREVNLDKLLQEQGLDRTLATDEQKADALQRWFNGLIDNADKAERDTKLLELRQQIADAPPTADTIQLWNKLAELREQRRLEEYADKTLVGQLGDTWRRYAHDAATFLTHTVLSPSSVVVNTVSNSLMTFARPSLDFVARQDQVAFRQMTASYGAMFRVSQTALAQARLAFQTEHSLLTGTSPKWIEAGLDNIERETNKNSLVRFLGRNVVRIWMRLLNATDEFFQVTAYHGFIEGDATARALLAAKQQGLDKNATEALVKSYVEKTIKEAYTTKPDSTAIAILRDAGIKQGYTGDNLKLYVQNQLDTNSKLLRRATNEQGISYTNDLLFKKEFSGEGAASGLAKWYEGFVQQHPEMRIMGQLFFRTPVRVFEAGMRLTPGAQYFVPKFITDLSGKNGLVRQVRARGEALFAYGAAASIITAYASGNITGSGYDSKTLEQRKLVDAGWRPYSIKVGDKYISYRNYDPFSTPIKVIVNAMERLEKLQYRTAQGELEDKSSLEQISNYVLIGVTSILRAVRDANLTSGIDEWFKLFEGFADPEQNENKFHQLAQSKTQLLIPNFIRKGVKSFGEGQNVANDPTTVDQIIESTINPASERVTHQYDALGFKRATMSQGFFPYIGIDAAGREARTRGLSERDAATLNEIAKMTMATGKVFNPSSKVGDIDLKEKMTADGRETLFNKAMREFNKNMPQAAAEFFQDSDGLATGRRGMAGPRAEAFEKLYNSLWKAAIGTVAQSEPAINNSIYEKAGRKQDVFQGNREVSSPFIQ